MPVPASFVEDVHASARDGAAAEAEKAMTRGHGVPDRKTKGDEKESERAAVALAHLASPYLGSLKSSLNTNTYYEGSALLQAVYHIFKHEHPDNSADEGAISRVWKGKVVAAKSAFASGARKPVFDAILAAVKLFVEATPRLEMMMAEREQQRGPYTLAPTRYKALLLRLSNNGHGGNADLDGSDDDDAVTLLELQEGLLKFFREVQLETERPDDQATKRGVRQPHDLTKDVFSAFTNKHSSYIEKDKDGKPVRGPYSVAECFGVDQARVNAVVDNLAVHTMAALMDALEKQHVDFNTAKRKEEEDSQQTEESEDSSPLALPDPGHQEPGFRAVHRAKEWLEQRRKPADGGGGPESQAFNKELFASLVPIFNAKLPKPGKVTDIVQANRLIHPYLVKNKNRATSALGQTPASNGTWMRASRLGVEV